VGPVKRAYLAGDMAMGIETLTLELVLVGTSVDKKFLQTRTVTVEKLVHRNIRYLLLDEEQEKPWLRDREDLFLIWNQENNPEID